MESLMHELILPLENLMNSFQERPQEWTNKSKIKGSYEQVRRTKRNKRDQWRTMEWRTKYKIVLHLREVNQSIRENMI